MVLYNSLSCKYNILSHHGPKTACFRKNGMIWVPSAFPKRGPLPMLLQPCSSCRPWTECDQQDLRHTQMFSEKDLWRKSCCFLGKARPPPCCLVSTGLCRLCDRTVTVLGYGISWNAGWHFSFANSYKDFSLSSGITVSSEWYDRV